MLRFRQRITQNASNCDEWLSSNAQVSSDTSVLPPFLHRDPSFDVPHPRHIFGGECRPTYQSAASSRKRTKCALACSSGSLPRSSTLQGVRTSGSLLEERAGVLDTFVSGVLMMATHSRIEPYAKALSDRIHQVSRHLVREDSRGAWHRARMWPVMWSLG